MNFEIKSQLLYLAAAALSGIFAAFVYDILRAGRKTSPPGVLRINIEDIGFILFSGAVFLFVAYNFNGGDFRIIGILIAFLGAVLYFWIFKNKMVRIIYKGELFARKVFFSLLKLLFLPVKIFISAARRPVMVIAWHTGNVFYGGKRKVKNIFSLFRVKMKLARAVMKKR